MFQDLLDSAEMLMGDLKTLMDHQAYMRQREEIHRSSEEVLIPYSAPASKY
jgi:hypothetical protein